MRKADVLLLRVVTAAAVIGAPIYTYHEGIWSSSLVDSDKQDKPFHIGALACSAKSPVAKSADPETMQTFFSGCAYNQWCIEDPVFTDQSVAPPVDYEICADVARIQTSRRLGNAAALVIVNLTGYPVDGSINPDTNNDNATQVLTTPTPLAPETLRLALADSKEACTTLVNDVRLLMTEDVEDAMAFNVDIAVRVSPTAATGCDDPEAKTSTVQVDGRS
jgi:hypothetical protein